MDKLDIKIVRELSQDRTGSPFTSDIRRSIRAIGRSLGVDEGTGPVGFEYKWVMSFDGRLITPAESLGLQC